MNRIHDSHRRTRDGHNRRVDGSTLEVLHDTDYRCDHHDHQPRLQRWSECHTINSIPVPACKPAAMRVVHSRLTCGLDASSKQGARASYAYVLRGCNCFTVVSPGLTGLSLPLDDWLRSIQRVSDVEAQTTKAGEILKVGERLDIKTFAARMRVCR